MQQLVSSKKFLSFVKKTVVLFGAIFLALVFLFGIYFLLQIKKIIVKEYTDSIPLRGLRSFAQKNLLLVSPDDVKKIILTENPTIRSVAVQKAFPNTLIITVESQPFIAIFEMNSGYVYLSENGKIIQKSKEKKEDIPLIKYYQKMNYASYNPGESLEYNDILTALHFLKTATEVGLQTDTVDINGFDMLLFSVGDKKLFFTTEKKKETQDYELRQIIKQFKIEGRDFKSLDLRFEKPIIVF
jgi:hypothetical protein